MKRVVFLTVFVLVFVAGVLRAQTVVMEDTFTLTETRTAESRLVGQLTEATGLFRTTWHGETDAGLRYYRLTDGGQAELVSDGSWQDRMMTVPYIIHPDGEVVTLQADFTWPSTAAGGFAGVGFIKATATPDDDGIMLWEKNVFSVRLYNNGRFELFGDKLIGDPWFRWIADPSGSLSIPSDTPVTVKLQYDSLAGTLNVWVGETHYVTDFDIAATWGSQLPEFSPEMIGWAGFMMQENSGVLCDNFKITSTNPSSPTPTKGIVNNFGVNSENPTLLDWVAVDGQIFVVGSDAMPGAGYDIDPDYTLYSTDPNGPEFCIVAIDEAATPPTTQLDAEFLTADKDLATGCMLAPENLPANKASIGQFVFDMPIITHDGSDIVVISIDRIFDCSSEENAIVLLDASLNPLPGQTVMVSCGQTEWNIIPGVGGNTQSYDVTGVDPSFSLSLRVDSLVARNNYTAYAIDAYPGLTVGGLRITAPVKQSPVEVFAIPQTGSYSLMEGSCEDDVYALTDLNKDCYTNLEDFALLAAAWLDCNKSQDASCWQ